MTNPMTSKLIKSLHKKKFRDQSGRFLVEGGKSVAELISSNYRIESIYATTDFKTKYAKLIAEKNIKINTVQTEELNSFGTLEHNDGALAIAYQKKPEIPKMDNGIILALDGIRDPGNLGTIIRLADWYGIKDIVCSSDCVDWHNPKTIAATMGSFIRINRYYCELPEFLKAQKIPKIGALMNGASAHKFAFPKNGILVIGSESNGISHEAIKQLSEKITIPRFGGAESLNAANACGILLDRWIGSL